MLIVRRRGGGGVDGGWGGVGRDEEQRIKL